MEIKELQEEFFKIFGTGSKVFTFHSPGRVNLIGEHTDYNGGYVFPCALSFGTYGVVRKRSDDKVTFVSTNFDLLVECSLSKMQYLKEHDWANYLKGIIVEFQNLGHNITGMDILISGNIPNSSGLSSSASVEMLMAVILNDLFECNIDTVELVKMTQHSENEYIGVKCGIMDQFAIGMGRKDSAMLLNCDTLEFEYIPVILKNHKLVISNTNKRRGLADSKYNERREQCEKAVAFLNTKFSIKYLGELTVEDFEEYKYLILDETVLKRAQHVVYEIHRTIEATLALRQNNIKLFGKLMTQSHNSLRDLYDVTGIELDTLVLEALKIEGVVGSRMTGAGFGGCTISIVENDKVDEFIQKVGKSYLEKMGYEASFYIAQIGNGTSQI